jgi:hypothetical protein
LYAQVSVSYTQVSVLYTHVTVLFTQISGMYTQTRHGVSDVKNVPLSPPSGAAEGGAAVGGGGGESRLCLCRRAAGQRAPAHGWKRAAYLRFPGALTHAHT